MNLVMIYIIMDHFPFDNRNNYSSVKRIWYIFILYILKSLPRKRKKKYLERIIYHNGNRFYHNDFTSKSKVSSAELDETNRKE